MVRLVVAFWAAWCVVAGELDSVTIMSYNIRTASRWATVDGGDGKSGRSWAARKRSVAKTVEISGAAVAGVMAGVSSSAVSMRKSIRATFAIPNRHKNRF